VLVRICSKATFFDLSENNFEFPSDSEASEAGGGRTHLRHVVELVRNMQKVTEVDLRNQQDLIGKCKQQTNKEGWHGRHSWACLTVAVFAQILMGCSIMNTSLVLISAAAGEKAS
jgi:hypothetical protein